VKRNINIFGMVMIALAITANAETFTHRDVRIVQTEYDLLKKSNLQVDCKDFWCNEISFTLTEELRPWVKDIILELAKEEKYLDQCEAIQEALTPEKLYLIAPDVYAERPPDWQYAEYKDKALSLLDWNCENHEIDVQERFDSEIFSKPIIMSDDVLSIKTESNNPSITKANVKTKKEKEFKLFTGSDDKPEKQLNPEKSIKRNKVSWTGTISRSGQESHIVVGSYTNSYAVIVNFTNNQPSCNVTFTSSSGGHSNECGLEVNENASVVNASVQATGYKYDLNFSVLTTYDANAPIVSSPIVADYWAYFGSADQVNVSNSTLHAIDYDSAAIEWTYTADDWIMSSPGYGNGTVVFGVDSGNIIALDENSGVESWKYTVGDAVRSSPSVPDEYFFIGSDDSNLYSIWILNGSHRCNFTSGGAIRSSPGVYNASVYFGSNDQKLYTISESDCTHKWNYTSSGEILSSPAFDDHRVYFGSIDGVMWCLNASNSSLIWNYSVGSPIESSPAVFGGRVIFGANDSKVWALDTDDGTHLWNYTTTGPVVANPALTSNNRVVVTSTDGKLYVLDSTDGSHRWNYSTGDVITSSPAIFKNRAYFGSYDQLLHIFTLGVWESDQTSWPMLMQNASHSAYTADSISDFEDPSNVNLYAGNDNTYVWNVSGVFNYTNSTISDFHTIVDDYITRPACNLKSLKLGTVDDIYTRNVTEDIEIAVLGCKLTCGAGTTLNCNSLGTYTVLNENYADGDNTGLYDNSTRIDINSTVTLNSNATVYIVSGSTTIAVNISGDWTDEAYLTGDYSLWDTGTAVLDGCDMSYSDLRYGVDDCIIGKNTTANGQVVVPLNLSSTTAGIVSLHNLNISYNTPPIAINVSINNSPIQPDTDAQCNCDCWDADEALQDTFIITRDWYRNDTLLGLNLTTLSSGNYSNNDYLTCSCQCYDGYATGGITNSTTLQVGDSIPPYNSTPVSFSAVNPCSTDSSTATVNVSDVNSDVDTVYLETTQPSGKTNISMSCSGSDTQNQVCTHSYSGFSTTITVNRLWMSDASNNWNVSTVNQAITFHTCDSGVTGGSGGGVDAGIGSCGLLVPMMPLPTEAEHLAEMGIFMVFNKSGCNLTNIKLQATIFSKNYIAMSNVSLNNATDDIVTIQLLNKWKFYDNVTYINVTASWLDDNAVFGRSWYNASIPVGKNFWEKYGLGLIIFSAVIYVIVRPPPKKKGKKV